jgi:hypothetical protein
VHVVEEWIAVEYLVGVRECGSAGVRV